MTDILKNIEVFPEGAYNGANLSYVTAGSFTLASLQIQHPEVGTLAIAISNDYKTVPFADKLWTPLPVRLLGQTTFINEIDFATTGPDPVIVKFGCFSNAFLKFTLTGTGGIYRAVYNVPDGVC